MSYLFDRIKSRYVTMDILLYAFPHDNSLIEIGLISKDSREILIQYRNYVKSKLNL